MMLFWCSWAATVVAEVLHHRGAVGFHQLGQLIEFLSNGGSLYIEGVNVAEDMQNNGLFGMLGAEFIDGGAALGMESIHTLGNHLDSAYTLNYSWGTDADYSVDMIQASGSGVNLLASQDGIGRAVYNDAGTYRTIASSVLISAMADEGVNTKYNLLQDYLRLLLENYTDVDDEVNTPVISRVTNYPNPFNPSTTISFDTATAGDVEVNIYNTRGQLVKSITERVASGEQRITWDGQDSTGQDLSSGVYLYRVKHGRYTSTKKMILMK